MVDRHATGWRLPPATANPPQGWPPPGSTPVRVLELDEYDALLAVIGAAREGGPWPRIVATKDDWYCLHCRHGVESTPSTIIHADGCKGIALRDALAALDGLP